MTKKTQLGIEIEDIVSTGCINLEENTNKNVESSF